MGEIIQLRQRLINGDKMEKEERKAALKVATPEMKEVYYDRIRTAKADEAEQVMDSVSLSIQAKLDKAKTEGRI